MNMLGKLFLKGLAVVIPVTLTLAILWWFARTAERFLGQILVQLLPQGWYLPGMGLVSALAITVLVGLLAVNLVKPGVGANIAGAGTSEMPELETPDSPVELLLVIAAVGGAAGALRQQVARAAARRGIAGRHQVLAGPTRPALGAAPPVPGHDQPLPRPGHGDVGQPGLLQPFRRPAGRSEG